MAEETSEWIKTLRERTHKLVSGQAAVELRLQALQKELETITTEVRRMATADEIAKGVADELRRRESEHRARVDSGMRRLLWVFGTVLALLQIMGIVVK